MFKPINENILIELPPREDKTNSGIYLPEKEERESIGTVKAVGDKKHAKLTGKEVYFQAWAGHQLGDNHILVKPDQILAIKEG